MKNIILIVCIALLAVSSAFSQTVPFKSQSNSTAIDTVTNTGVKFQNVEIKSASSGALVQVNVSKISGTTAGVVRLLGSVDGVNFIRINKTDSLNIANVANVQPVVFDLVTNKYPFYQVSVTGSGTSTFKVSSFFAIKK